MKPDFVLGSEWPTCGTCIYWHEPFRPDGRATETGYCGLEAPRENNNEICKRDSWCGQWQYIGFAADPSGNSQMSAFGFPQQVLRNRTEQAGLMRERAKSGVH